MPPIAASPPASVRRIRGYWSGVGARLLKDRVAVVSATVLALIVLSALLAPWLGLKDPFATSVLNRLAPIGKPGFLLGGDELGRDMLSRLVHGGRMTLLMGFMPVLFAFFIGSTLGIVAGYAGGAVNMVIMRCMDVAFAFPSILLAIAIAGVLGPGMLNSIIALTIVFTPPITRVAESVTTGLRSRDFIEAARAIGGGPLSIVRVHILGNVLGPIFVFSTSLISVSMILASGLSFLGLGISPPAPEWGLMLSTLRTALYVNPMVAVLPGVMIFLVSLSFNLFSDSLRNAMGVKR